MKVRLAAPAKINLHLEILGQRADGYHELETVFQCLDLHDEVQVELTGGGGIALACDDNDLPHGPNNLAWRAASEVQAVRPRCGRILIDLRKRIPVGAGLGGGSSDAAAVLRALQRLLPTPLPAEEVEAIAAKLGSDVAFFLRGGTAHALGRGEQVTPLDDLPQIPVTVLKPPVPLATPEVYGALNPTDRGPRQPLGVDKWKARLRQAPVPLFNRMTEAACRLQPAVGELLAWLGQKKVPHLMSGSGSACFALAHLEPPAGIQVWNTHFRPRARLDAI